MSSHHARQGEDFASYSSSGQMPLIMAMGESCFYPKRPSEVTHRETHISHLFFADDLVYKVKKSVRFSFVDYSTLSKRRHFLHEELRWNQRLAPSVYLGVLPISHENDGWQLGSDANPVEYTLVMRRLPEKRMLDFLLERNQVTLEMIRLLAETLAPFHAQAQTGGKINASGDPESIRKIWDDNLADIRPFVGRFLDAEEFRSLSDFGDSFITKHKDLLARRVEEGRIRELHGDLHCEHICFAPEGIQIFDCVEFNPRLRCCDISSEVAFLVMDMEFRGAEKLARDFLTRYRELVDDHEMPLLLPFYKCYRAVVRGKVTALQSDGKSPQACRYFNYACRVRWETFKPFLVLISGPTGSGKSTLARAMSQRLGVRAIGSDATRKALAGVSDRQDTLSYEEGIYHPSMTQRTFAKMAEEAEKLILRRDGVILDGTFHRKAQREAVLNLAAKHRTPLAVIQCQSAEDVVRERLGKRAAEGRDLSDGRWEIYLKQKTALEPFKEFSPSACLSLNTDADVSELCKKVEPFLQQLFLSEGVAN